MLLPLLSLMKDPFDVIQFVLRITTLFCYISMLYFSFRGNSKGLEQVSSGEYNLYLSMQVLGTLLFFLDSLFNEFFGCSEAYRNLYNFNAEGKDLKRMERACEGYKVAIRCFVRVVWLFADLLKIRFSFKIAKYVKLVSKSRKLSAIEGVVLKSEPVVSASKISVLSYQLSVFEVYLASCWVLSLD